MDDASLNDPTDKGTHTSELPDAAGQAEETEVAAEAGVPDEVASEPEDADTDRSELADAAEDFEETEATAEDADDDPFHAGLDELASLIEANTQSIQTALAQLQEDFESKIQYDSSRDQTVAALHRELQSYKQDFKFQLLEPLVVDLLMLYDDIVRVVEQAPADETDSEVVDQLVRTIDTFCLDIEEMLLRNGFELFEVPENIFDRKMQHAQRVELTDQPELDRQVGARLRKGVRYGDRIVRREGVVVYRYQPPADDAE